MNRMSAAVRRTRTAMVLTALALLSPSVRAAEQDIKPLPPDETYYGMKLVDWAVAFFQWKLSFPRSSASDVTVDRTSVRAGIGQRAPVWFLPIRHPGTATRTFTVPEGQAILTVVGSSLSYAAPGAYTDSQLHAGVDYAHLDLVASAAMPRLDLDGVRITNLKQYRVVTPVFTITLPPGNDLDVPVAAGKDSRVAAVGAGHFLLFPPLPIGRHVYTFQSPNGVMNFRINLIVQKPNVPLQ
jgi:hypothetical protein